MSAVVRDALPALRDMQEADLAAVMAIEQIAYEFPWTDGIMRDCLRFGHVCKVYEAGSRIIGYGILSVAADECHFLNICIDPALQRRGHGARLVEELLQTAREAQVRTVLLEVRASNGSAYRLYHRLGFNEIGVRKNYYPARNGREDALILAREL